MTVRLLALPPPLPFADRKKRSFSPEQTSKAQGIWDSTLFLIILKAFPNIISPKSFILKNGYIKLLTFLSKTTSVTCGMFFLGGDRFDAEKRRRGLLSPYRAGEARPRWRANPIPRKTTDS